MQNRIFLVITLILCVGISAFSQDVLQKSEAISIAMENNFDIQIATNNVSVAKNNASVENSNYLPSVTGGAGANYATSDGTITPKSGEEQTFYNNETQGYSASLGLQYTVFDGFGRSSYNKILKSNFQISELQARFMIETTILGIFDSYYEVARLSQDVANQKQTMAISRVRLQRAKYGFEYGQGSQLDILNAEVDYNNDSITYLTNSQLLANEKRNLNFRLGRDVSIDFSVDTTLVYDDQLTLQTLTTHSKENNVTLLQQLLLLDNAKYNVTNVGSNAIPKLSVNANYEWNDNHLGATSFNDRATTFGPYLGASLNWNIFDGGSTRIRKQNSKIELENQSINLDKERLNVERNLSNAWTAYQTALFVKNAQQKNVETAKANFDRSVDQYKLGQISNIVFRQAQLNLLNAQLALSQAKYLAKTAELFVLQISGDLDKAKF